MKVHFLLAKWFRCIILLGILIMCECRNVKLTRIQFTTVKASKSSYMMFIKDLRNAVLHGTQSEPSDVHGIPMLPQSTAIPRNERFVQVQLSNWAESSITMAIDVTNVYVVGYRTGTRSFFLRDTPAEIVDLFPGTTRQTFSFDGSYGELERAAGTITTGPVERGAIPLGMVPLENAISSLYTSSGSDQRDIARAFIVCIQMISEVARFRTIEQMVRESVNEDGTYTQFTPNPHMLSLENSWGDLSTEVQAATSQTSIFGRPVMLQDQNNNDFHVHTVRQIFFSMAIMKFICKTRNSQLQELIRFRSMVEVRDEYCPITQEPKVLIRGRNDLCVDVSDGRYNDGNPIVIYTCGNNQVNQLWTFKTDGTIRSNSTCLTTYGYSPGSYVMIYNCDTAVPDATKWELWSNGSIVNPRSGLVLSATSGNSGTTLTVETNNYSSSQGWFVSKDRKFQVWYIVGYNDLCLYTNGSGVWVVKCSSQQSERWVLYPDGTIRPQQNSNSCLVGRQSDKLVHVSSCTGSNDERWVFENDGTIKSLYYDLVMDVRQSDPNLKQIIIYTFTGNPNQIWYLRT